MATTISGSSNSSFGGTIDSTGIDDNATSTAVTIDSSGNVLVGKTSADGGVAAGHDIRDTGLSYHTVNGGAVTVFNRLTSDGDIAIFRKDGSTVGTVGAFGGTTYYAGNTHGLLMNGTQIEPSNNAGGRLNNTIDLGSGTYKFKDLYLSGGAYLGGTGVANKLDDYEEGTWTPTLDTGFPASPAASVSSVNCTYTKIGRLVHLQAYFIAANDGISIRFGGFPFTVERYGSATVSHQDHSFKWVRIDDATTWLHTNASGTSSTLKEWYASITYSTD